eukprot:scaffold1930_cov346-Prasinococcus_capsulatus_cf.AAC.6
MRRCAHAPHPPRAPPEQPTPGRAGGRKCAQPARCKRPVVCERPHAPPACRAAPQATRGTTSASVVAAGGGAPRRVAFAPLASRRRADMRARG